MRAKPPRKSTPGRQPKTTRLRNQTLVAPLHSQTPRVPWPPRQPDRVIHIPRFAVRVPDSEHETLEIFLRGEFDSFRPCPSNVCGGETAPCNEVVKIRPVSPKAPAPIHSRPFQSDLPALGLLRIERWIPPNAVQVIGLRGCETGGETGKKVKGIKEFTRTRQRPGTGTTKIGKVIRSPTESPFALFPSKAP